MRKIVFLLFIFIVIILIVSSKEKYLIPDNAIRIRIIANSDDINDQKVKSEVKNKVNDFLYEKFQGIKTYKDADKVVKDNIREIDRIVSEISNDFNISYGQNYFPSKEYKGMTYKEGNYDSLVIKLGRGEGLNFWCVLFPPLCLIDEENMDNITYTLYVKKLLKNIK